MGKAVTRLGRTRVSPDGGKRTKHVGLAVTEDEFQALNEAAKKAELSRAEYILQSTIYANSEFSASNSEGLQKYVSALNEVKYLLEKESGNLNQIAFGINTSKKFGNIEGMSKAAENVSLLIERNNEVWMRIMNALKEIPSTFRQPKRYPKS